MLSSLPHQRCGKEYHWLERGSIWNRARPSVRVSPAWRLPAYEDPLQDALYNTWGEANDDWGVEEYNDEQLIDILYEVGAGKEYRPFECSTSVNELVLMVKIITLKGFDKYV